MSCNYNYQCAGCVIYDSCDDANRATTVEVEAMTKEDVLTMWELIKQKFSLISHRHAAGDINSGVLPIARGGTGGSTAAEARTNLGVAATSHEHAAGDITSGTLPIARGGTGQTAQPSMLTNLASTTAADVLVPSPRPGVTGKLPIANGGTGADTAAGARTNLGVAASNHTHAAGDINSGTLAADRLPTVPVAKGGTGATTAADARTNLGAAAASHTHGAGDITSGTLPIARGGTGGSTAAAALTNLGAASVNHKHFAVATVQQANSDANIDQNQELNEAGYITFNRYIAPVSSANNQVKDKKGEAIPGLGCSEGGVYLVAGQLNFQPTPISGTPDLLPVTLAIALIHNNNVSYISRAMQTSRKRDSGNYDSITLSIPLQFVEVSAGDKLALYCSYPGNVTTNTGAALTALYVSSGIISG